jgi:deferrochelatase/peroxidase EfeB
MGFKDGTRNLRVDDAASVDRFVWVGAEEPQAWFRGGTYVVARRIRMLIEAWDRDSLGDQEASSGVARRRARRSAARRSSIRPTWAARRSRRTPTSAWPHRPRTAA